MIPRYALILAVVGAMLGAGYYMGYTRANNACKAAILVEIEKGKEADNERLALEEETRRLERELAAAGDVEPVVVQQCLGPSRVRRLNQQAVD